LERNDLATLHDQVDVVKDMNVPRGIAIDGDKIRQ
jgi:hypothetical protein